MKFQLPLALATLATLNAVPGFSQGIITGTISGTVTDASGAVVPNATVVAVDNVKGTKFTTISKGDGIFTFQALPIDTYTVTISSTGFANTEIKGVVVATGTNIALGKEVLSATGGGTTVEVEGNSAGAELDVTQSQVSATFDSQQLESLPLGNGFDEVALLTPGVVQTHDLNFSNTNGPGFSSNGSRGRSNNFELDGQSNNDNSVAGPQIFFGNQDAIAEIQVIQSNFSAQYGRNTGAVVNYITKSGTNSIHGSGFELFTGNWLSSYPNQDKTPLLGYCSPSSVPSDTNPCSPVARLPRSVDNRYGATIGAPIIKDKLFAFGSTYFEHTRNGSLPFNSGSSVTPTPAGLQLLTTDFPNNPGVIGLTKYGPYGVTVGNPQPVANSPYAGTEPVALPGGGYAQIPVAPISRTAPSGNYTDQEDLGRIDWQATAKDRLYVRYFYQTSLSSNNPDGGAGGTFYDVPDKNYSVGADLTHTFTPAWLNQLRYAFQESKLDFQAGSLPGCTVNTLTACPGYFSFSGGVSNPITGKNEQPELAFGEATNLPQGRTVKVTQVQDNASFTRGKQTILFGGEVDIQNSPNVFLPLYNGSGSFSGLDTLLQQSGNFSLAAGNPVIPFNETDYALYFQDDLKVFPSLTLNLGLRWEFFGEAVNQLHNETVARESNPATAIWDPTLPLSQRTTPLVANDYKNFEPRFGFAWNPDFDKKLVIRGGYSIGYDPAFYNIFLNAATVAPLSTSGSFACGGTCLGTGDFTGAGLRSANLAKLPIGGNPAFADQTYVPTNFHNDYLETYSLGIEHQLTNKIRFTLGYVGTHGVGNFQSLDANPDLSLVQANYPTAAPVTLCSTPGAPGTSASFATGAPTARPNCNVGNLDLVGNTGFTIYNSLVSQTTFSNYHGLSGTVNFTFSHATDNSSEVYSSGAGGNTIAYAQNPLNSNESERGTSGFSLPQSLTVGLSYAVPKFNAGNSLVSKLANGFQVNSVYQITSGQPYNPYQPLLSPTLNGLDRSYCDTAFNASTVGPGADSCRLVLSNKNAPLQTVALLQGGVLADIATGSVVDPSATHWIINNTDIADSLGNPYPGSGRNILRAQRYNNLDASIFKDTHINERVLLELQLNAYNALNHDFRGTPGAYVFYDNGSIGPQNQFLSNAYNNSAVGGNVGVGARNIQLGAKVKF